MRRCSSRSSRCGTARSRRPRPAWTSTASPRAARGSTRRASPRRGWWHRPGIRRPGPVRRARRAGRRSGARTGTACAACRVPTALARSLVLQVAVDELDRHRALADRGGHPLDRVGPHVARGEHAGDARLEVVGITVEPPATRPVPVAPQVGTGQNEPPAVTLDHAVEPLGPGGGADEYEDVAGWHGLLGAGRAIAQGDLLEVIVAVQ